MRKNITRIRCHASKWYVLVLTIIGSQVDEDQNKFLSKLSECDSRRNTFLVDIRQNENEFEILYRQKEQYTIQIRNLEGDIFNSDHISERTQAEINRLQDQFANTQEENEAVPIPQKSIRVPSPIKRNEVQEPSTSLFIQRGPEYGNSIPRTVVFTNYNNESYRHHNDTFGPNGESKYMSATPQIPPKQYYSTPMTHDNMPTPLYPQPVPSYTPTSKEAYINTQSAYFGEQPNRPTQLDHNTTSVFLHGNFGQSEANSEQHSDSDSVEATHSRPSSTESLNEFSDEEYEGGEGSAKLKANQVKPMLRRYKYSYRWDQQPDIEEEFDAFVNNYSTSNFIRDLSSIFSFEEFGVAKDAKLEYFDTKIHKFIHIYEMIILLAQGVCTPSLIAFLAGNEEDENSTLTTEDGKTSRLFASVVSIVTGDFELFHNNSQDLLKELGVKDSPNVTAEQKAARCMMLVHGTDFF